MRRLVLTFICGSVLWAQDCEHLARLVRQSAAAGAWKQARALAEAANPDTRCAGALLTEIAALAWESSNFSIAGEFAQRSLLCLQKTCPVGDIAFFRPLQILASVYLEEHQVGPASRVLEQLRATKNQTPIHWASIAGIRGMVFHMAGEPEKAEREYCNALELWEVAGPTARFNSIEILNNLSSLYVEQGRLLEARAIVARAQRLLDSDPDTLPVDKIASLNTIAAISYRGRDYAAAAESLRQASQIASALPASDVFVIARLLSNYALVLRKMKRKDEARIQQARADSLRRQTGGAAQNRIVDLTELRRAKY